MSENIFKGHEKVDVKTMSLTSLNAQKTINIIPLIRNVEIFCSIFTPVTTGRVRVTDSTGIVQNLPIVGEEALEVTFQTEGRREFTKIFHVYGIVEQEYNDNGAMVAFTLKIASLDNFKAMSTSVNRGARKNISEFVRDIIVEELATENALNIEETNGVEHIILPNWTIWESIEYLRKRAVSVEYASPFLFFEDQSGYNFLSYEKLIEQRQANAANLVFHNTAFRPGAGEDQGRTTILPEQYRNVSQFEVISRANSISRLQSGGMFTETLLYDPFLRTLRTNTYNFNDLSTLIKRPLGARYHAEHSQAFAASIRNPTQRIVMAVDSTSQNYISQEAAGAKALFAAAIGGTCIGFTTNGDSELQPGDVINFIAPTRTESPEPDRQITGLYIIGSLKHGILDGVMYDTIEAYRFGFNEEIITPPEAEANTQIEVLERASATELTPLTGIDIQIVTENTDINSSIGDFGDSITNIRSQINSVASVINSNVANIRNNIANVQSVINTAQSGILGQYSNIGSIAQTLQGNITNIQNIANVQNLLPASILQNYTAISSLANTLQQTNNASISDISSIFNIINSNISTITGTTGPITTEIAAINTQITALHSRAAQLTNTYTQLQSRYSSINRSLGNLNV